MNQKAYKALEYYKIINMLTDKASSSMGKEICRKLEPSTDIDEIRHMQTQTRDALTRLFQKGNISFGSVKDVRGSLKRLEIGSSLGIGELLAICSLLENTNRVKAYSRSERGDSLPDSLDGMFEALEPLTPLTTEIRRCILSEDEISDDASSNLRQIRRNMKITGDRIHTQLSSLVNGSAAIICRIPLLPCETDATAFRSRQNTKDRFRVWYTISPPQVLLYLSNLWQS